MSRLDPRSWRARAPRNLEQAEAERLREQLVTARRARDVHDQRREALVDSVLTAVPVALGNARTQGWDAGWAAGWEAARNGLPKTANPMRSTGPV